MKRLEANFVLLVAACTLLGWASVGMAATNTAVSVSLSDVQAAVNAASPGDTVLVPPGKATWSSSLSISKQINLIGAGNNATFVTNAISGNGYLFSVSLANGNSFRVSGFYFECNWTSGGGGFNVSARVYQPFGNDIYGFRIDHCTFANCYYQGGVGAFAFWENGRVNGVVDHCNFVNCSCPFQCWGTPWGESTYPSPAGPNGNVDWSQCPAPYYMLGSTTNVVVETCYFLTTRTGGGTILVASQDPAHWVFRYNTVSNSLSSELNQLFDAHGNMSLVNGYERGVICEEIYNNTFAVTSSTWQFIAQRGGTGIIFSNTVYGSSDASITLNEEETYPGNNYFTPSCTYPAHDQVTNSFFWGNSANVSVDLWSQMQAACPNFFQQNRDYWLRAPQAGDPLQNYKPLVYPHPLVTAQDSGSTGPPPSAPTNLRIMTNSVAQM